jgi:hypothetical protein
MATSATVLSITHAWELGIVPFHLVAPELGLLVPWATVVRGSSHVYAESPGEVTHSVAQGP